MADISFEARVTATGLRLAPEDLPKLQSLVNDIDRAAQSLRSLRPYAEEPLSAFRLKPTQATAGSG